MRTFTVKRLAVQTTRYTEHDVILCAYLADSADLSGETFMFQQNLAGHDEQDRELGQDTYCLTTSPGQATHYGGITRYHFDGKALTLYLDGDAGRFYGTEGIRFDLQVPTRFYIFQVIDNYGREAAAAHASLQR